MNEICLKFGIEKRRSSAKHSQGNGSAEHNIGSVREILRSVLLDKNIAQKNWRQLFPGVAFALKTSEDKAIKCIPYNVVFRRPAVLPQDVLLGASEKFQLRNVTTAVQCAEDINFGLQEIFHHVLQQLAITRQQMQQQYNKNLRFFDYKAGEKVWLKMKHYKSGENRKLSPRRSGPWTIMEKLPNGVNFCIVNDSTKNEKIVHHNRLTPIKENRILNKPRGNQNVEQNDTSDL